MRNIITLYNGLITHKISMVTSWDCMLTSIYPNKQVLPPYNAYTRIGSFGPIPGLGGYTAPDKSGVLFRP